MDDNINIIVGSSKEIVSFNDFQTLVHHGSTIECNFSSHIPVGVSGSLGLNGSRIFFAEFELTFSTQAQVSPALLSHTNAVY